MERLSRALRALARADTLIVTIWLSVAAKRGVLLALAALAATVGFAMLDVAGYFALEPHVGPLWAALIVAGADFLVAAVLALASTFVKPGRDLELATELRDHAVEQLAGLVANPVGAAGQALVGPLTSILMQVLRSAVGRAAAKRQGEPERKV